MSEVLIRPATRDDLPHVVALARELYDLHAADHPLLAPAADFEAQYLKALEADLAAGGYHLAVAEVADYTGAAVPALTGFADAYIWTFPYLAESRRGFVSSLYVGLESRGHGVGRALVEHLHRWLEGEGVAYAELNVSGGNAQALDFWAKVGYRPYIQRLARQLTAG